MSICGEIENVEREIQQVKETIAEMKQYPSQQRELHDELVGLMRRKEQLEAV
jgi:hypothetical protein